MRKNKDFSEEYSPLAPGPRGEGCGPGAGAAAVQGGPGGRQEGDAGGQHQDQAESRHQARVREDGGVRQDTWTQETQDLMTKHANADTFSTNHILLLFLVFGVNKPMCQIDHHPLQCTVNIKIFKIR